MTKPKDQAFVTQRMEHDAARPYAVIATFRNFNKVVGRYADEAAAKRRARDLNRATELLSGARIGLKTCNNT